MKKLQLMICVFVLFLSNILLGQFEFEVKAWGFNDSSNVLIIDVVLRNTTDESVEVQFTNQESCQAYFSIDDYDSRYWIDCLPLSDEVTIPANGSREYLYFLNETEMGLPTFDGSHKIVAGISFDYPFPPTSSTTYHTFKDSILFESRMALGGRLSVRFAEEKDSMMVLLKDSLNVNVLRSNYYSYSKSYSESWQFFDIAIDTIAEQLKSNQNFQSVEINRILDFPNVSTITSVEDEQEIEENIPFDFRLFQNYPNPFNPTTVINYQLAVNSKVQLRVFNLLGKEIATLVNKEQTAGSYNVNFDAAGLSSGIYIYQLETGKYLATKKMLFIK